MEPKLARCQGSNLLNHLHQKNLDIEIEQYQYLSARDLEVEECRSNIIVDNRVNLLNNPEYYARIKFSELGFKLDYIHKDQKRLSNLPLWRTKLSFQGKTVYSLSNSKKNSLSVAVSLMDSHIRKAL